MTGIKILAVSSATGLATVANIDPFASGTKLGSLAPSAILGVVCVVCVIALVRLYRDKQDEAVETRKAHDEHTQRLYAMVEANTKESTAAREALLSVVGIMVEVKDAVKDCRK